VRKFAHKIPVGGVYLGSIPMEEELKEQVIRTAHHQRIPQAEIIRRALRLYFKTIERHSK